MAWSSNLQTEILEQFADVRWHDAVFATLDTAPGLASITENDNWQVVARKVDDVFAARVREMAVTRFSWRCADLARELGTPAHAAVCTVGKVLARTDGWVRSNVVTWTNKPAVLAWCRTQTDLQMSVAAQRVGMSEIRLSQWLRADGWHGRRIKPTGKPQTQVWNRKDAA